MTNADIVLVCVLTFGAGCMIPIAAMLLLGRWRLPADGDDDTVAPASRRQPDVPCEPETQP